MQTENLEHLSFPSTTLQTTPSTLSSLTRNPSRTTNNQYQNYNSTNYQNEVLLSSPQTKNTKNQYEDMKDKDIIQNQQKMIEKVSFDNSMNIYTNKQYPLYGIFANSQELWFSNSTVKNQSQPLLMENYSNKSILYNISQLLRKQEQLYQKQKQNTVKDMNNRGENKNQIKENRQNQQGINQNIANMWGYQSSNSGFEKNKRRIDLNEKSRKSYEYYNNGINENNSKANHNVKCNTDIQKQINIINNKQIQQQSKQNQINSHLNCNLNMTKKPKEDDINNDYEDNNNDIASNLDNNMNNIVKQQCNENIRNINNIKKSNENSNNDIIYEDTTTKLPKINDQIKQQQLHYPQSNLIKNKENQNKLNNKSYNITNVGKQLNNKQIQKKYFIFQQGKALFNLIQKLAKIWTYKQKILQRWAFMQLYTNYKYILLNQNQKTEKQEYELQRDIQQFSQQPSSNISRPMSTCGNYSYDLNENNNKKMQSNLSNNIDQPQQNNLKNREISCIDNQNKLSFSNKNIHKQKNTKNINPSIQNIKLCQNYSQSISQPKSPFDNELQYKLQQQCIDNKIINQNNFNIITQPEQNRNFPLPDYLNVNQNKNSIPFDYYNIIYEQDEQSNNVGISQLKNGEQINIPSNLQLLIFNSNLKLKTSKNKSKTSPNSSSSIFIPNIILPKKVPKTKTTIPNSLQQNNLRIHTQPQYHQNYQSYYNTQSQPQQQISPQVANKVSSMPQQFISTKFNQYSQQFGYVLQGNYDYMNYENQNNNGEIIGLTYDGKKQQIVQNVNNDCIYQKLHWNKQKQLYSQFQKKKIICNNQSNNVIDNSNYDFKTISKCQQLYYNNNNNFNNNTKIAMQQSKTNNNIDNDKISMNDNNIISKGVLYQKISQKFPIYTRSHPKNINNATIRNINITNHLPMDVGKLFNAHQHQVYGNGTNSSQQEKVYRSTSAYAGGNHQIISNNKKSIHDVNSNIYKYIPNQLTNNTHPVHYNYLQSQPCNKQQFQPINRQNIINFIYPSSNIIGDKIQRTMSVDRVLISKKQSHEHPLSPLLSSINIQNNKIEGITNRIKTNNSQQHKFQTNITPSLPKAQPYSHLNMSPQPKQPTSHINLNTNTSIPTKLPQSSIMSRPVSQPCLSTSPPLVHHNQSEIKKNLLVQQQIIAQQQQQSNNIYAARADYFGDKLESYPNPRNNIVRINNKIVYSPQKQILRNKNPIIEPIPSRIYTPSQISPQTKKYPITSSLTSQHAIPQNSNPVMLSSKSSSPSVNQYITGGGSGRPVSNLIIPMTSSIKFEQLQINSRPKSTIGLIPNTPINELKNVNTSHCLDDNLEQSIIHKIDTDTDNYGKKVITVASCQQEKRQDKLQKNVGKINLKSYQREKSATQRQFILNKYMKMSAMQKYEKVAPFLNLPFNTENVQKSLRVKNPTTVKINGTNILISGKNSIDKNHPIYRQYRDADDNYQNKGKKKFQVISKDITNFKKGNWKGSWDRNL